MGRAAAEPDNAERYEPYYRLYRELYPAMRDSFAKLAEL